MVRCLHIKRNLFPARKVFCFLLCQNSAKKNNFSLGMNLVDQICSTTGLKKMDPTFVHILLCTNGRFFRSLFSFERGSFLVLLLRAGPAGERRGQCDTSVGSGRALWPML